MASFNPPPHTIHIHNAPIMHRVYNPPHNPGSFVRHTPYPVNYHPGYYHLPPGFDPSVSLAHPYVYDPTQVKHRRRTTPEQLKILEDTFKTDPKPNPTLRKKLSLELEMSPRVLQVWFQNRRMKVKRLAKKRGTAEHRLSSDEPDAKDVDQDFEASANPSASSPAKSSPPSSAAMTPCSTNHDSPGSPISSHSPAGQQQDNASDPSAGLAPPQDITSARRGSLPTRCSSSLSSEDPVSTDPIRQRVRLGSSSAFEAVTDPALCRRRSMTSLHRLESHPFAPFVAANNAHPHGFAPIVPPTLPPSFPMSRGSRHSASLVHHHHSPSTPAPHLARLPGGLQLTNRSASFHALPAEHHHHAFSHPYQNQQHHPYAFPPRPLHAPGPGPLPASDYSFGTSTPASPTADDVQEEFDVRPYVSSSMHSVQAAAAAAAGVSLTVPRFVQQSHDDGDTDSYTEYSSRFGSIASVAESDTSASASGQSMGVGPASASSASGSSVSLGVWDGSERWSDGRIVRRDSWTGQVVEMMSGLDVSHEGKSDDMVYESMWEDTPLLPLDNGQYMASSSQESLGAYTGKEGGHELTYPDSEEGTPPAPSPQYSAQLRVPISQSSELAYALCSPQDATQGQGQGGDEMLELHHALARYVEHPSVDELAASYSIGTFTTPGQDGNAPSNTY